MNIKPDRFIEVFSTGKYAMASNIFNHDGRIWVSPETEVAMRDVLNASDCPTEKASAIISCFRDDPKTDMGRAEVTRYTKGQAAIPAVGLNVYSLIDESENVFATLICQGKTVHDCFKAKNFEPSQTTVALVHSFVQKRSLHCAEGLSIDDAFAPDISLRKEHLHKAYRLVGTDGPMSWVRPTTKEALEDVIATSIHAYAYRNKFVPEETGCGFIQDYLAGSKNTGVPLHTFFALKDTSFKTRALMICKGDRRIVACFGANDEHAEEFGDTTSIYFSCPATEILPYIARFIIKNGFRHDLGRYGTEPWKYQLVPLYNSGVVYDAHHHPFDVSNLQKGDTFTGDLRLDGFKAAVKIPDGYTITGDVFANNMRGDLTIGDTVSVGRSAFLSNSKAIVGNGFKTRWHAHLEDVKALPDSADVGGHLVMSATESYQQLSNNCYVGGSIFITGIEPATGQHSTTKAPTIETANIFLDEHNQRVRAKASITAFETQNPSLSLPDEVKANLIKLGVGLGAPVF